MQEKKEAAKGEFIIPAIDVIDGKCVRLTRGDYSEKKVYNEFPLEVAMKFEDAGFRRLHLVDLDGAKAGRVRNWKVLEQIASRTRLRIEFGGGLKSMDDIRIVMNSGATWATVGSVAVEKELEFQSWIIAFGAERFILGADVRDGHIAIKGWTELTELTVTDLVNRYADKGIEQVFCTDIQKDGMLEGPSFGLYETLNKEFPAMRIIASGGVSCVGDVERLKEAGCSSVIIGKAIYEGRISLEDLSRINEN